MVWYGHKAKEVKVKVDLIENARWLVKKFHEGQRYGANPYSYHLAETAKALRDIGGSSCVHLTSACYLHDILEDTKCTVKNLREMSMSDRIIDIVQAVTDEPGENRKERKNKTYPKIAANQDAVIVKLCDRIANVTFSIKESVDYSPIARERAEGLLKMYAKEHEKFYNKLCKDTEYTSKAKTNLEKHYLMLMSKVL